MKTPALDLLEGVIDYAGLYPPAKLPLAAAVRQYLEILSGDGEWMTSRFVCPASQRHEVNEAFAAAMAENPRAAELDGDPFPLSLVGSPGPSPAQFEADAEALLQSGVASATAYEVRLPVGPGFEASLNGLKKLVKKVEKAEMAIFVELDWSEGQIDQMHMVAEVGEDVGFKARTGGVIADAFPAPKDLARFIVEAAALEAPFKFTAGLHEPIRYQDDSLGVMRHGFINVLAASALAVTQFLSAAEVAHILELTDPGAFKVTEEAVEVAGHMLSLADVHEFRAVFGGFGSCSVEEPLAGLARVGWLPPTSDR